MADRLAIWKRALETTKESPDAEPRPGGERHRPLVADLGHTRLDLDRLRRTGVPEAVYAEGKAPYQVVEIVSRLLTDTDHPIVLTRTTEAHRDALAGALLTPDGRWSDTLTWRHADLLPVAPVAVVSGGTSDQAVVDECVGTLTAYGIPARAVRDVGVAGLHRLLDAIDGFSEASVLIAVAGMEAALATVLAGLVPNPIIAVPTSVGYGATFEGVTALLSLMSSCAPGITVVGIDNGFGAACAARRIVAAETIELDAADHPVAAMVDGVGGDTNDDRAEDASGAVTETDAQPETEAEVEPEPEAGVEAQAETEVEPERDDAPGPESPDIAPEDAEQDDDADADASDPARS